MGLDFLGEPVTVQDPVRGAVAVPAGSLMVVNGADNPDRLYYLDPAGAGTILADVPLAGGIPLDEQGAVGVAYHPTRHSLFILRGNDDLITEINPATGAALKSFHSGFGVGEGDIAVHPSTGDLFLGGNGSRLVHLDPQSGRVLGTYDPIGNAQWGTVDLRQQGVNFQGSSEVYGLAFDNAGALKAAASSGRIIPLTLPGAPTSIQVGASMAVAIDGTPADPLKPSANARQRIRIIGSGYNRFTEVEFPRIDNGGSEGFVRVRADVGSADGTALEVVVPDEAVTGRVRVSGAPGSGVSLQVVPVIRPVLPADPSVNFDVPVTGPRWTLFGSG
ncbi:MAG: hypothetical protein AAB270_05920, partial [Chloroflexota bacterium]